MSAYCLPVYVVAALAALSRLCWAAYPLGRYGRSLTWAPLPLYYHRNSRPLYYPDSDYYYPQPQEYYYPLPTYYLDQQRPYYYSYDETDPQGDLQGDLQDEGDREDYGQEAWSQDTNAEVNARFLENLVLAQMYGKNPEDSRERWVYGEPVLPNSQPKAKARPSSKEDEDVRELKSLVSAAGPERRNSKLRKEKENVFAAQTRPKSNNWDEYRSNYKRSEISVKPKTVTTTPQPSVQTRGQKEVVAPRPAVTRSHEPSVYDTIKKLLHMEDLAQDSGSRIQKRSFVPSEESLVAQLGRLKKMS